MPAEGDSRAVTSTETVLDVLSITQRNRPFKTAKPSFIGSIPIAASQSFNYLPTVSDLNQNLTVVRFVGGL